MFDASIVVRGTIAALKESTFEGKTSHTVQLLKRGGRNNAVEVVGVKLPEGADPKNYAEGKTAEFEVELNVYEGTIYYKALREAAKAEARGEPHRTKVT